jgi:Zn-dependent peptidase ImmA (M78 family)
MNYESLIQLATDENICIYETEFSYRIKGMYIDNTIAINSRIETSKEKYCILAEELGHHFTTVGDITDLSKSNNRRQEEKARRWAAKRISSLKDFINAFESGCRTKEEFMDYMNLTEEFLIWSIDYYRKKHGLMTTVDKQYIVYFEPFGIIKMFK